MKYYAFLDLYTLSTFSQSRRAVIFADHTGNYLYPPLYIASDSCLVGEYWQALATRCCAVVDNCTARVETAISQGISYAIYIYISRPPIVTNMRISPHSS